MTVQLLPWDAVPKDVILRCWRESGRDIVAALRDPASRGRVYWWPDQQMPLSQPGSVQRAAADLGAKVIQFDIVMHTDGRQAVVGDYRGEQVILR